MRRRAWFGFAGPWAGRLLAGTVTLCLLGPSALAAIPPDGGPPTPGALIERATEALARDDLDAAEADAAVVLAAWPESARARLILARVAARRGHPDAVRDHLTAATHSTNAVLADYATQLLAGMPEGRTPSINDEHWHLGGRVGVVYDSAVDPRLVQPTPDGDARAGGRAVLSAWGGWRRPQGEDRLGLSVGGGVDRSVHFASELGVADRTGVFLTGDLQRQLGPGRLHVGLEGRSAWSGRAPGFYLAAGGAHAAWYSVLPARPWLAVRGLAFAVADAAPTTAPAWLEAATGVGHAGARWRIDLRLAASWAGPDSASGFTDLGGDLMGGLRLGPLTVRALAGLGRRALSTPLTPNDSPVFVYPRAGLGLRWPALPNMALEARTDAWVAWSQNRLDERVITGLWLELWQ